MHLFVRTNLQNRYLFLVTGRLPPYVYLEFSMMTHMSTSSGLSYSRLQSASNGIHLSLTGSLNHLMPLPQFLHRVIGHILALFVSMRDKIVSLTVDVHCSMKYNCGKTCLKGGYIDMELPGLV